MKHRWVHLRSLIGNLKLIKDVYNPCIFNVGLISNFFDN